MKKKVTNFFRIVDPFFIFCVVAFVVVIPIGFLCDYTHLETQCSEPPLLFLHDELKGTIPKPFSEFINSATSRIQLVISQFNPHSSFSPYYDLLKNASDRGVKIEIVTNFREIYQQFNFADVTLFNSSESQLFVFFAQADGKSSIYASRLFGAFSVPQGDFLIHFPNCKSFANDASSLFTLIKDTALHGFPKLFPKTSMPGSTFPSKHSLPTGGFCFFGISPHNIQPPGRLSLETLASLFFGGTPGGNISVLTQAMFSSVEVVEEDMTKMLLSEQLEKEALQGSSIKIIVPLFEASSSKAEYRSLIQFSGIDIHTANMSYAPTFYTNGENCGFMPMPFEYIIVSKAITFALHMTDEGVCTKLENHFMKVWNETQVFVY
ncbi:hypothetical protein GPJ56_009342 [Histomonas meleagridis]|uniref:uncharacterized protein n=1 Tax=Histomonas meleagridis TaxID=135588 RepID=UPI00355A8F63|nr:hypothetical protein GPJ56_009342 [Histomonas meleagridis]KAH0797294.1 hypothetical protein GO595_009976 [Histomonas meleagridis]